MAKYLITQTQYNRIFASGPLSESQITKGGITRIDNTFKKTFVGSDIKNMEEASNFNIKTPNTSLPRNFQKFNKPMTEEVKNFVKYLYGKNENFSPFWAEHKLTYEDLCEFLASKGMIKEKNGIYEISKSLGTPNEALTKIEEEISSLIDTENISEVDEEKKSGVGGVSKYRTLAMNNEIAILKNGGDKYILDIYSKPFSDEFEIDDFVNTNELTIGDGLADYTSEAYDIYKIDEELKNMLLSLYDKPLDKYIIKQLSELNEINTKKELEKPFKEKPKDFDEKSTEEKERILKKLADLRAKELHRRGDSPEVKETTGASSSGAFTGALGGSIVKKEMPVDTNDLDVPVVGETTTASSSGQYTAPAFDMKSPTEFSNKKPKAFKKTQYSGGGFVEFDDDCVKLNNSKKAQQGGCSQGAINNVVKIKKTASNVNAPSLGTNKN